MATTDEYEFTINRLIAGSIAPAAQLVGLLAERAHKAAERLASLPANEVLGVYERAVEDLEREVRALGEAAESVGRMAAGLATGGF